MRGPDVLGPPSHDAAKPRWLRRGAVEDTLLDASDLLIRLPTGPPTSSRLCHQFLQRLAKASGTSIEELRSFLRTDQVYICHPGKILAREGEYPPGPSILLSGWACHQRISKDGRRQIFAFILPGDLMGCWSLEMRLQADIVAITPLMVLRAGELCWAVQQLERYAALADHLHEMEMRHIANLYQHIQRLGSQTAVRRVYDLLWELHTRLDTAGQHGDCDMSFPLTQETLADALGMSSVHINRVLQQMRREGLISLKRGLLTVHPRRDGLAAKKAAKITIIKEHTSVG